MVSIFKILGKYTDIISLFLPIQKIDMWLLEKFLKGYKPRKNVFVMAVGGMYGEKDVIKLYHQKNHKIKHIKVAACNILPIYFMNSANYDLRLSGKSGDASKELTWRAATLKLNTKKFDLVYMRFPDLFKSNNWESALDYSLKYLTKNGRVFMLVRKVDLKKLERFLNTIKHKPILKKKTGIKFLGRQSSIYHTVVVFRN